MESKKKFNKFVSIATTAAFMASMVPGMALAGPGGGVSTGETGIHETATPTPAADLTFSADKTEFTEAGGNVTFTLKGVTATDPAEYKVEAADGSAAFKMNGEAGADKTVKVTLPANETNKDIVYTYQLTQNGTKVENKVVEVKVKAKAAPAVPNFDNSASYIFFTDDPDSVTLGEDSKDIKVRLLLRDVTGNTKAQLNGKKVVVWASSKGTKEPTTAFEINNKNFTVLSESDFQDSEANIKVNFLRDGTYELHASVMKDDVTGVDKLYYDDVKDLNNFISVEDESTIEVEAKQVSKYIIEAEINGTKETIKDGETAKKALKISNPNGVEYGKVVVKVMDQDSKTVGKSTEVKFDTNTGLVDLNKTSEKTGHNSTVEVRATSKSTGTYKLYVTVGNSEFTIPIEVGNGEAGDITLVNSPDKAISDDTNFSDVDEMKDHIKLAIKDNQGNYAKASSQKFGHDRNNKNNRDYIKVLKQPKKDQFEGKNFTVKDIEDTDYATLVADRQLPAGSYSLELFLDNGRSVKVDFEVAAFGKVKELKMEYPAETIDLGKTMPAPKFLFVDDKGVTKSATNRVTVGFSGYAIDKFYDDDFVAKVVGGEDIKHEKGEFTVKDDEKYLGSKITVTAIAEREGLMATSEITVAEEGKTLKFDSNAGPSKTKNPVKFQVVDKNGKKVALGINGIKAKEVVILPVKTTEKDAKVSANFNGSLSDLNKKGEGEITVYSDRDTKAEFSVYVRTDDNKFYSGNLEYEFGAKDTKSKGANKVVMSINSKSVITENGSKDIDVAPMIKDNRTFVPYRALAESFGADVDWDQEKQAVTVKYGEKVIVMTIGSNKYTVDGKEQTMDTAPFLKENRTMVPVRFVTEAMGFTVTPFYHEDGTTSHVLFTK